MLLRLHTRNIHKAVDQLNTNMQNSPVVVDSMVTVKLNLSQWMQMQKKHSNLNPCCRRCYSEEYIPAVGEGIEEAAKAGILGGFPVLGVKLKYTMVLTMKSTHLKWHSTLPVLWL